MRANFDDTFDATIEQTVASIQQLTATVQNNAANARQGLELAQATSDLANSGGEVMKEVVTKSYLTIRQSDGTLALRPPWMADEDAARMRVVLKP
ncbi:hypothetical protein BJG93_24895 [Paraburkholderia sprentiae WSM5005]|uniref:Methyl-accepting transducer domain-containing protein n=1 Tax=Paraburkholderia sprentiae WSM5005 TaxID=754502 RepID=A0A1L1P8Q1_9BURK|nr:hypothetical protein [Paraburkholderia sprentiae]APA88577.1 hypothetical protein BJG93_24895 [Paraburkholderia sprentiae WSM5005]